MNVKSLDSKGKDRKYLHLAFTTKSTIRWAMLNGKSFAQGFKRKLDKILEISEMLIKKDIPIISFYLIGEKLKDKYFFEIIDLLEDFFDKLTTKDFIKEYNVKVNVIGRWYRLPDTLKDKIKKCIEATSENQYCYLNFFIHYDGHQEILDAIKSIVTQILNGKFDVDAISPMLVKEYLYTSYFMPPDIIFTNVDSKTNGFLLWDSKYSKIININKLWPDITKADIEKYL